MFKKALCLLLTLILVSSTNLQFVNAWSDAGHKLVASICYRKLSPEQRKSVADILRKHPRFHYDFEEQMPTFVREGDAQMKEEWLFQQAAIWPDLARGGHPARQKYHRAYWHFVNLPHFLSDEDKELLQDSIDVNLKTDPPADDFDNHDMNIIQAIKNSRRIIHSDRPDVEKAVHICWLLHTCGDISQPLHSTALFSQKLFPRGDEGGNQVATQTLNNLHSAWDRSFGSDRFSDVRNLATTLLNRENANDLIDEAIQSSDPVAWRDQSNQIAVEHAYSHEIMLQLADREEADDDLHHNPIILSEIYLTHRRNIADRQAVLAGMRVAVDLASLAGGDLAAPAELMGAEPAPINSIDTRLRRLEKKVDRLTELLEALSEGTE